MALKKEGKKKEKNSAAAHNKKEQKSVRGNDWVCMLKGMAAAMGITCIIFIGFGILLTYTSVSEERLPLTALICTAVSAAVGGYDWASCKKKKGLFWGACAGAVYILLLFFITALEGGTVQISLSGGMMLAVALTAGGIGGIFGVNRKR